MYKSPKLVTQKNPPLNRPSEYKPRGLVLGNCPQIRNDKTKQKKAQEHIIFVFAKHLLHVQMITVRKCHSLLLSE